MIDEELNKITDKMNTKSDLFQNSSELPAFEDHFDAMLLEEKSKPVNNGTNEKRELNNH